MVLYHEQDESLWNRELIAKGAEFLHRSSQGNIVSKYHLEAGIAYWHTVREDTKVKWENILDLYNRLLIVEYSPVAALNRAFVVSKVRGREEAIREAENLKLENNRYYHTLLGELYKDKDPGKAFDHFQTALRLAGTVSDKKAIRYKLESLKTGS
jgi:RNA polymerase sigma-70 factor (ECF subfamily)